MFDQMEEATALRSLSALLVHPDFQRGLADAHETFLESYEPAPLTEAEMVEVVEMNISLEVTKQAKHLHRLVGGKPSSYLANLGYVVGIINEGFTYTL